MANREPGDPLGINNVRNGYARAVAAVMRQVMDFIPEPATVAAVAQRDGAKPRVAAVDPDGHAIYVVELAPITEEEDAQAQVTRVSVDPMRCNVTATSHREQGYGEIVRITDWRFEVGPVTLEFGSEIGVEDESAEHVAQALARAIGWMLPTPGGELRDVA